MIALYFALGLIAERYFPSQRPREGGTPEARPLPQVPGQRPPADHAARTQAVKILALAREKSPSGDADLALWELQVREDA